MSQVAQLPPTTHQGSTLNPKPEGTHQGLIISQPGLNTQGASTKSTCGCGQVYWQSQQVCQACAATCSQLPHALSLTLRCHTPGYVVQSYKASTR